MSAEILTFTVSEGIATVTMDDGKANALSMAMLEALDAAMDRAEAEVKAMVLMGREGKFCAGFDLRAMMGGPDSAKALVTKGAEVLMRLYELPMPVVMGCTGHALAGGALVLATGDTRIGATGSFKIGLNEVHVGMPVPILAHELARDRLVRNELFASVVQAKIYDPQSATRAGWLDRVVAPDQVLAEATAEAQRLSKLSTHAYGFSKRSLRRQTAEHIRATIASNMVDITTPPS